VKWQAMCSGIERLWHGRCIKRSTFSLKDRWQGVFCLNEPIGKEILTPITDMEFWGLALREYGNTEEVLSCSNAQGAVFWHDNVLHVYPAHLGAAFESFLQECLLPDTSE